jgi:hypothetical protein
LLWTLKLFHSTYSFQGKIPSLRGESADSNSREKPKYGERISSEVGWVGDDWSGKTSQKRARTDPEENGNTAWIPKVDRQTKPAGQRHENPFILGVDVHHPQNPMRLKFTHFEIQL